MSDASLSSRRAFLRQSLGQGTLGLVVLVAGGGCGKMRFTCTDTSGLSDTDKQQRVTLAYTDTSADPNKLCKDCVQWLPPQGSGCGACKVMKGPVHPEGTCNLFAKKS
jgi:hypothetical protein